MTLGELERWVIDIVEAQKEAEENAKRGRHV